MITPDDLIYMRRCLLLAGRGFGLTKPNPMVGAVIVARGRIIGQGWHRKYGGPHAEVNAFASVKPEDEPLLGEATLYVSLEPCSHYGKTPPCADLVVNRGVRRVVAGMTDPNPRVAGQGLARIRAAGIEVDVGALEADCRWLNRRFITYHTEHRPHIILKWAQTASGYIDCCGHALRISSPLTLRLMHRVRAMADAVAVGRVTDERECPRLDARLWDGSKPRKLVLRSAESPAAVAARLYAEGVQTLLIEGGRTVLEAFLAAGLWDEIRRETAPDSLIGCCPPPTSTPAPTLPPEARLRTSETIDGRRIEWYVTGAAVLRTAERQSNRY